MKLITCEFNMDSGCVELRFDDGTALDIDCTVVEAEHAHTVKQKTELDWIVYNAPLEYAQLVLSEGIRNYLLTVIKYSNKCITKPSQRTNHWQGNLYTQIAYWRVGKLGMALRLDRLY